LPQGEALRAVREDSLADRIGERMRSRLFEMCRTIEVNSTDFRREVGQSSRARA
jgi:DNA replication protein DnaC